MAAEEERSGEKAEEGRQEAAAKKKTISAGRGVRSTTDRLANCLGPGITHSLIEELDIRVVDPATGEILRHLTLDPKRDYQPQHKTNKKTPKP